MQPGNSVLVHPKLLGVCLDKHTVCSKRKSKRQHSLIFFSSFSK